ncbi:MAG: iron uptake porin [Stenomitos rutilans HA7619-LM2]|nr:iron uptake porin [Stenomitos rutilans HA7619-LM2]
MLITCLVYLEAAIATDEAMDSLTLVSQLSEVRSSDWVFQALQLLAERYGCLSGSSDGTYRGNLTLSRYEFASGLNACLNQINQLIASRETSVTQADLATLQKLQEAFATELATLCSQVDALEARSTTVEAQSFSTTTKLHGQIILAATDTFGDRVGAQSNQSNASFAYRTRLNLETSFTGKDLLRVRLESGNFGSSLAVTGTNMTRLNFDRNTNGQVVLPHLLYRFPIGTVSIAIGTTGEGYTDITDTVTPPTIADDSRGVPSRFGEYSSLYRQNGGGIGVNWNITPDLKLTLGYLAGTPSSPIQKNGLFNGGFNALAQFVYTHKRGAVGIAYSRLYAPGGRVDLTGSVGSLLASQPFGNAIATSGNTLSIQGFHQFTPKLQVHGWVGYTRAEAESSGLSQLSDGQGGSLVQQVEKGSSADLWYGAIAFTFPDVGGKGNLPGLLIGLPPHITRGDIRRSATSLHIEAFYRFQVNDFISITPGFWLVTNPENSSNATQYVGVIRASFNF